MVDILILGATGFTGKLIARYLVNHPKRASSHFTLALGGRSREKLSDVATSLGLDTSPGSIVVVDLSDYSTVEQAVVRAKVVINAIGPYWRFGDSVVRACAIHGVHYVDLSPEPHFVADVATKYDFMASKTNALIVPACGFGSIPPDLLVFVSNRYVKAVLGPEASIEDSVTAYDVRGGFSGGTGETMMSQVEDVPWETLVGSGADYAACHPHGPPSHPTKYAYKIPYNASSSWYGAFWPQRLINRQTVHHSWSLFERNKDSNPADAYGDKFRYDEFMRTPDPISALFVGFCVCVFIVALLTSPVRWALKRVLPKPGTGPSSDVGRFEIVNVTKAGSLTVKTTLKGEGEIGYYGSARMISEAALAIVLNSDELPCRKSCGGGVLTPATAFGDVLIRRLEEFAGLTISSESIRTGETKKTK